MIPLTSIRPSRAWLLAGGLAMASISFVPAHTNVAAQGSCAGASPVAAATTPATVAALPTQAAVEQEVNPPGDIPDNQAFVPYTSTSGGYTISMPEGWARSENGNTVTFADKLHSFAVEIRCAATAPTVDSVKSDEAAQLAATLPAFELVDVSSISLPAGPAILLRYRINSAPDDVTGKNIRLDVEQYELFANGKLAVITLAVPAGSDNVDVSNLVSQSFKWNP